ncbi:hypothetical protein EVAR_102228_1 [Eumeta japonica]|uniref:Uncharacterized protein n=1 Tax=Eumeta variegata TaxID=151549 RepID=A0A4C1WGN2_EUMVA|nr:hypothetical protein EVAR_102228_1 [Eumeta japonica]
MLSLSLRMSMDGGDRLLSGGSHARSPLKNPIKNRINTQTQNEDTTEFEPKSSQAGSEKQSTSIAENSRNGGTISSTSLHSGKPVNRKRKTDIPIDMAIKELKAISKENKEQVEDEFDLFCKSLAIQLKKMP